MDQFQIFYRFGSEQARYQPDFVSEAAESIYMIETKARKDMSNPQVLAKRDAAFKWCELATIHAASYQGKPWKYLLIPHDAIADNMTLDAFDKSFAILTID
jgi:type III restriction enzyme